MKLKLLIAAILLSSCTLFAQPISRTLEYTEQDQMQDRMRGQIHIVNKYKSYSDGAGGNYMLEYHVHTQSFSIPATNPPGAPHYFAKIQVYKIIPCRCFDNKSDTVAIGELMNGQYVEGGCFEDVPAYWVNAAIKSKLEAKKE